MTPAMQLLCKHLKTKFYSKKSFPLINHLCNIQFSETGSIPNQDPSEESILPPETEYNTMSEEDLMKKRDISRMKPAHRAIVHNQPIPLEAESAFYNNLASQRALYGKYGSGIGVNPAVCFMTKEEIEDFQEYEKVAHSEHILDIRKRKLEELAEEKRQYKIREEHYEKMMATVEQHRQRLREKILSKISAAEEAKKKREALLEEVKRHFGYTIDPKDERFQLMLEQKEKEQKKLRKELKKKKREEYFMAKLASLESGEESTPNKKTKASAKSAAVDNQTEKDSDDEEENEK